MGRRTKLVLPNGINVLYNYDTASRLTNITYQGAVTNKIDYTYDSTGNRASQASGFSVYNLPSAVTNSYYNAANQQLIFGDYNLLYDDDGNVTNIVNGTSTTQLVWNPRNQLTNMLGAVTANFIYDGLGRRIKRTVNNVAYSYGYDGLDVIRQKKGGISTLLYFRGLGIDEPWLQTRTQNSGSGSTNGYVYLADALGSTVAVTDTNQNMLTQYAYEPLGATTITGAGNKNTYMFTAREDDGTALYYYGSRY